MYPLLRDLSKAVSHNLGNRTLIESIMVNEVAHAFADFIENSSTSPFMIIGGIALSYYVKPRTTMDIDLMFMSSNDIPFEVEGFRRNRAGAFEHKKTGVEIEVLTPNYINLNSDLAQTIFHDAKIIDGVRVASPAGLIALKLSRFSRQDQADIEALLEYDPTIDLSQFNVSQELMAKFKQIKQ